ncbi:MAG: 3-dehydroquinate synthase [Betaproteobacteria bacterium]|nr:3-dehydroquinate synthase [Betaproteobacteria bacterium]
MIRLEVGLAERSYPILIGSGLLTQAVHLLPAVWRRNVVIVSNPTVAAIYLPRLVSTLTDANLHVEVVLVPDGERFKNSETLTLIHTRLLELGADRMTTLVALGGGVVGDLTGFAAATYQRGIEFIQVPTTLLAQVDSSVGGKTGVNHRLGKNMVGAFHQPQGVLIDTECLQTLPPRELSAGLAEVIKYGLIRDAEFFHWIELHHPQLVGRDQVALAHAIRRSCEIKAEIVGRDERESGERALLNFGHTFGHAIEAGLGYGSWLHGEAVAAGMMLATELSHRLGMLGGDVTPRVAEVLRHTKLPATAPDLGAARYRELMQHDKKVQSGTLRLVLLAGIGCAAIRADVPESTLLGLLSELRFAQ